MTWGLVFRFICQVFLVTAQLCALTLALIVLIFPLVFCCSLSLQRRMLFLTFISYPKNLDLSNPRSLGLYGTRSFFVNVEDTNINEGFDDDRNNTSSIDNGTLGGFIKEKSSHSRNSNRIKIGVWHVLPNSLVEHFATQLQITKSTHGDMQNENSTKNGALKDLAAKYSTVTAENQQHFYESLMKLPGNVIILYLHGNTASRGSPHRLGIYRMLRKLDYHVVTFDYRGYGDSDKVPPSEEGLVCDTISVYKYITSVTKNPVIIWGHSLGTAVATHMLSQLNYINDIGPRGVVLEAPFTNIREEVRQHPFARPFKYLPWFDITISRPMYKNSLRFESDRHISNFRQPVLILHAEDDCVVPFHLGFKLYHIALDTRGRSFGPVEMHRFPATQKCGHRYICTAPELPEIVQRFINTYQNEYF